MSPGAVKLQKDLFLMDDIFKSKETIPIDVDEERDNALILPWGTVKVRDNLLGDDHYIESMEYDSTRNWKEEVKFDYLLYLKRKIWHQTYQENDGIPIF